VGLENECGHFVEVDGMEEAAKAENDDGLGMDLIRCAITAKKFGKGKQMFYGEEYPQKNYI